MNKRSAPIADQLHKSKIHMQLLVTVHERVARVIRYEIDCNGIERHDIYHIFEQAAHLSLPNPSDLECVSMEVHWMLITASIPEYQTIALALLNAQRRNVRP